MDEDDYRQPSPFAAGALGNFPSNAEDHVNECVARIETLKLQILGMPFLDGFKRTEILSELNTLRAAYLHLCTLAGPHTATPDDTADRTLPRGPGHPSLALEGVLGTHPVITEHLDRIARIAPSGLAVLLEGETGSGKELFARIIHLNSKRRAFVPVNCGALPSGVIESELFGHVKGAFTGATADRKGRFEEADGGTIFLDEIGELEPLAQVKLLRTLDVGEIQRVGSDRVQKVAVRVIAATNRNLEAMVTAGKFREDLYFRLNICHFVIPPLRERRDEIALLLDFFLKKNSADANRPPPQLDQELWTFLVDSYHFPGNIRELKNIAQYIVAIDNGSPVRLRDLPRRYADAWCRSRFAKPGATTAMGGDAGGFKTVRARAEQAELVEALTRHHGRVRDVCVEFNLSRARVYQLFKKYDLKPANFRGG